jgi:putative spermidine/putrescine transport system substrate-binding protein
MLKSLRLAVVLTLLAGPAFAQSKLTVAAYGGVWDTHLRQNVFPEFEKKHNVKIDYVAGNSTDTLAKLQAQKSNQVIDVAIMDDGVMYQAIQLGFCTKIEGMDKSELYPAALFKDDKAVAVGQTGTGFMINTKVFKDKGWAIPTSWNDLKDPKFKKQLVIPPINNTYGLYALMMYARMNGGGEKNIDPGFKVMNRPSPTRASLSTSSIPRKARRSCSPRPARSPRPRSIRWRTR